MNQIEIHVKSLIRVLALRDMETEEHSRRVAKITLDLAKICGIPKREWNNIWHGALLHDIGKIGIPDRILLKRGTLTEDERFIIRKHPVYAYELLEPIPYLRPALDIPYCHHEKWDGTGYPRGLKGEQIPLAARVSAVVDVWDALVTDRPYRAAWKPQDAERYILEQSGKYFDPAVVRAFLNHLNKLVFTQHPVANVHSRYLLQHLHQIPSSCAANSSSTMDSASA